MAYYFFNHMSLEELHFLNTLEKIWPVIQHEILWISGGVQNWEASNRLIVVGSPLNMVGLPLPLDLIRLIPVHSTANLFPHQILLNSKKNLQDCYCSCHGLLNGFTSEFPMPTQVILHFSLSQRKTSRFLHHFHFIFISWCQFPLFPGFICL